MTKLSIWDWLAYISLAILIAYFILKVLGIINSPIELDIIAIVSGAYLVGRYTMKINMVSNNLKEHSKELKRIKEKLLI